MRRELLVPKLGLTMTEGTLLEWLVNPGDSFRADQSIFIIESEKASIEIPAEADGVLLEATADIGSTLTPGTVLGYWEDGSSMPTATAATAAVTPPPSQKTTASAQPPAPNAAVPAHSSTRSRLLTTPLARRLAHERGIDLNTVTGSGPRGRIRARDLQVATTTPAVATTANVSNTSRMAGTDPGSLRPATPTEQTIARRLVAAKQEIPHFYLAVEAEVSALQKLRAELNATQSAQRFTLNHFLVAATGRALAQMPQINRIWTSEGILALPTSDVGMAVHTERGLMVPVLRDVGRQSLSHIARDASLAATQAQAGHLTQADMAGGSITVSNAGMHDVTYMTSIINPGQAMILGVGSVRCVFRPDEQEQPRLRRELGMVLSADHRVLNGVTALQFLKHIVSFLERPLSLLVA